MLEELKWKDCEAQSKPHLLQLCPEVLGRYLELLFW